MQLERVGQMKRAQDQRRSIMLVAIGMAYLVLAILARVTPMASRVERQYPWDGVATQGLYVEGGTYGLEVSPDFYWIKSRKLQVRIVNPEPRATQLAFSFHLGPTVCGTFPRIRLVESNQVKITSDMRGMYWGLVNLGAKTSESLILTINAKECRVSGDPRVFRGSISTLKVTKLDRTLDS